MNITQKDVRQNICENITQIQADTEALLYKVFEQAGNNIQAEKQAEYTQAIANTKAVIERFKNQYGCVTCFNTVSQEKLNNQYLTPKHTTINQYQE